jgi:hypothetical protein
MVMHSEQDAGCRVICSAPMLGAPSSRSLIALRWAFARKREPSFSSLDPNFADLQKGAPTTPSIAACQFSAVILSVAKDPRTCFLQCRCRCCCLFLVVILERSEGSPHLQLPLFVLRRHPEHAKNHVILSFPCRCLAVALVVALPLPCRCRCSFTSSS